jgi:hypothetical protein
MGWIVVLITLTVEIVVSINGISINGLDCFLLVNVKVNVKLNIG